MMGRDSRLRMLARFFPGSLFGRLTLILFFGLSVEQALSFTLVLRELSSASQTMMISYLARDVATTVAILERVEPGEREAWLPRLDRKNYRYGLYQAPAGAAPSSPAARQVIASVAAALGDSRAVTATSAADAVSPLRLSLQLRLSDGTPLTVELFPPQMPPSVWTPRVLLIQLLVVALFAWLAVRLATRPLAHLAEAADALRSDMKGKPLQESGPLEVVRAIAAFNAMQRRIADHLAERMQILAAISHDLQTPITRMRLRADLLDNAVLRDKLNADLDSMQVLVEEGITYARGADGVSEHHCRTDLNELLDSLVCDYQDAGREIRLFGRYPVPVTTRPHTLRRILTNLADNALKFAHDVEISIRPEPPDHVSIVLSDRGPGVPPDELEAVLRPFYRVESSRNRETGGTGLGLAIAQQLALALKGSLTLCNRPGGGLEARLLLPVAG
jgi:signal transduction histidine kinase